MAVWFMRWLQGVLCEQSPLFDSLSPVLPEARAHHRSKVETTRFARAWRNHLNYLSDTPGRRRIGRRPHHYEGGMHGGNPT